MCCLRFDADVLLANIYGSPSYKKSMEIHIYKFLEDYCNYLNNILPGYKFYNTSKEDIEDFVHQYNGIFRWKDETNKVILEAEEGVLNPDYFNQNYPGNTGERLKFAVGICLGVWKMKQEAKKNKRKIAADT
jgi:hypothetical protein